MARQLLGAMNRRLQNDRGYSIEKPDERGNQEQILFLSKFAF